MEQISVNDVRQLFPSLFDKFPRDPQRVMSALEEAGLDERRAAEILNKQQQDVTFVDEDDAMEDVPSSPRAPAAKPPPETRPKKTSDPSKVEEILAHCFQTLPQETFSDASFNVDETKIGHDSSYSAVSFTKASKAAKSNKICDEDKWFLVRRQGQSHRSATWVRKSILLQDERVKSRLRNYERKKISRNSFKSKEPLFNMDFVEVDRVVGETSSGLAVVKWRSLGYDSLTFEDPSTIQNEHLERFKKFHSPPTDSEVLELRQNAQAAHERVPPKHPDEMLDLPKKEYSQGFRLKELLPDGSPLKLRDYQVVGLNWLRHAWACRRNVILADEMGLGKTAQSIALLDWLRCERGLTRGPFLIVAPRSCVEQWQREVETWTNMNCVLYCGSKESRELCREYDFYDKTGRLQAKFDCLVTSYETVDADLEHLNRIGWAFSIIDEGHRLKNEKAKAFRNLRSLDSGTGRLLLTGTPVQNNVGELWALLNFLHPEKDSFSDKERFVEQFGDMTDASEAQMLHALIAPFILRREKHDVETSLKPLEETVVYVELTPFQKRCYRAIYENNATSLLQAVETKHKPNLVSIQSALRLCCSHPFLVKGVEEAEISTRLKELNDSNDMLQLDRSGKKREATPHMVTQYSGKLVLLKKLLNKLKTENHRVLIFSFFKVMLDMVEYSIAGDFTYERMDGDTSGNLRQAAMDRFQKDDGAFCFLLTTRAGGVGLNLQAADTVVMLDSDWNPQNDLQARARCHRIGQTKNVKVYRLVTRKTYEEEIFNRANKKLGLEQAINSGRANNVCLTNNSSSSGPTADEIEKLLRVGAFQLQNNEDDEAETAFVNLDIEEILKTSSTITKTDDNNEKGKLFNVATFKVSDEASDINVDDPDFWDKVGFLNKHKDENVEEELMTHNALQGRRTRRSAKKKHKSPEDDGLSFGPCDEYAEDDTVPVQDFDLRKGHPDEVERRRLETSLLAFGMDRLEEVRIDAELTHLKPVVVEAYANMLLTHCLYALPDQAAANHLKRELYAEGHVDAALLHETDEELAIAPRPQVPKRSSPNTLAHIMPQFSEPEQLRYQLKNTAILSKLRSLAVLHSEVLLAKRAVTFEDDHKALVTSEWWNTSLAPIHLKQKPKAPIFSNDLRLFRAPKLSKKIKGSPSWNANSDQDASLLLGVHKHGWRCGNFDDSFKRIRSDPELKFFARVKLNDENDSDPTLEQVEGRWPSPGQLYVRICSLISSMEKARAKKVVSCDAAVKAVEEKNRRKEAQKAMRTLETAKRERENRRKRALLDATASQTSSKRTKRSGGSKKAWQKTEIQSFVRALGTIGEQLNPRLLSEPITTEMLTFGRMADKIAHKTAGQISEFYPALLLAAHAADPSLEFLLEEMPEHVRDGARGLAKKLEKHVDFILAPQIAEKVRWRQVVRAKLFKLSGVESPKRPAGIPNWWTNKHDAALVEGVKKHGFGDASFDAIWDDPKLPFVGMDRDFDYVVGRARSITFYPKSDVCSQLLEALANQSDD